MSPRPSSRACPVLAAVLAVSPLGLAALCAAAQSPDVTAEVKAALSAATGAGGIGKGDLKSDQIIDGPTALKALKELRDKVADNAQDPKVRSIELGTIDGLTAKLKNDTVFSSTGEQLKQLPAMLQTQVALDQFKAAHPGPLSDQQREVYGQLTDKYGQLMASLKPPSAPGGASGEKDNDPGLMQRFHEAYHQSVDDWNSAHANGGDAGGGGAAPAPGAPGDPASPGGGEWTGLPPTEHIGSMIGDNPQNTALWSMKAGDELSRGDLSAAAADAQRAADLGGGAPARLLLGQAKYESGDYAGARDEAQTALRTDPGSRGAAALLHFSEAHASAAEPKIPSLGGAPEGFAPGGVAGATQGTADGFQGRLGAADLRRDAANAIRLNDLDGALAYVNRGLSRDAGNAGLLNMRATIFARRGDYEKAASDARAGLALAPRNASLLRTLAYAELRGKKYKDALASSSALIALDPKDAYAYALRAHAYGSAGERDAMMVDLQRAAELDPRFAGVAARLKEQTQLPEDKDILFLFPGEEAPSAVAAGLTPSDRKRSFGFLVAASALGGLLLALGLLHAVLEPVTERLATAVARLTRTGPTVGAAPGEDERAPAAGGLIRGQYEIARQIGMGGMGMVFAGSDRSLDRPVAIKKMREEFRVNPQERERFVIEARTVAALHHPNIVDIYAIAEDGADVYLIFEFVDGRTLHEIVQGAGRLTVAETARVIRAAADALGYAHSRGVVHRDMKPSNMMIDAHGRVKVMDFGIARMAKDTLMRYSMTNSVVGTPPYMAPEQEQGHVRRESDVYSLAVCAYEMLTGKLPFVGIGAGMLMNKINMSYVGPSRAIAGLPEALDEVFAKAFQADPDRRYRAPQDFADALESALPSAARA